MTKYLAAYGATAAVIIALDWLFLGVVAKSFYQHGIGHLLADRVIGRCSCALHAEEMTTCKPNQAQSVGGWS